MPNHIMVVGLGPGDPGLLTRETWAILQSGHPIYLRTARHPTVDFLRESGIAHSALDSFYEEAPDFDTVYRRMARFLLQEAQEYGQIVFAVPGHPGVGEAVVFRLEQEAGAYQVELSVKGAVSALDLAYQAAGVDPLDGLRVLDAASLDAVQVDPASPLLLLQLYDRQVASGAKLSLMEVYPDDHPVTLLRALGVAGEEYRETVPLFELDRINWLDHLTSLFVPALGSGSGRQPLSRLAQVMETLRGPGGCPWDREQTHQSLQPYLLEETYEVIEALEQGDPDQLQEELGDLLLQVVFHAQIARETGDFTLDDVARGIVEKLVRRHPHVFSDSSVESSEEVVANWHRIKQHERKGLEDRPRSILDGVPRALPALMRAAKIQKRAARVGFDWPDVKGAWEKVLEELEELARVREAGGSAADLEEELGDLLFAVVNVARFLSVEPEQALRRTTDKFALRFQDMEAQAGWDYHKMEKMNLETLETLWNVAKKRGKKGEKPQQ